MNKIMIKVAIIATIICIVALGALFVIANNNSPKGTNWYVFTEDEMEWTGRTLFLPESIEVEHCCHLWPAHEPLELGGYWNYSTDLDQWIVCY